MKIFREKQLIFIFSIISVVISVLGIFYYFIETLQNTSDILIMISGSIIGVISVYFLTSLIVKFRNPIVFISHSLNDSEFVSRLKKDLRHAGIQALTLDDMVHVGDNIKEKMAKSIKNIDFFLIVISEDGKHAEVVIDELQLAIQMKKKIFPVLKDKVSLPENIASIQYADFTSDYSEALSFLTKSIRASFRGVDKIFN